MSEAVSRITACTMDCPDTCSLVVTRGPGEKFTLRGNPDHPFTRGFTCAKIRRHIHRLRSPDRIRHPLRRKGGTWQRVSWEEALAECAEWTQQLRPDPAAILHVHGEGAKGVLKQTSKLFFDTIGATRLRGSLCDGAGFIAYVKDFGSRRNHLPDDLLNARRIINWGKDLTRSSVHLAAIVGRARKQGVPLLCISPGGAANTPLADQVIRIRPGTDRLLAAAVIRRLILEERISREACGRAGHWESFRNLILDLDEAELLRQCEASPRELEQLTAAYTQDRPAATIVGTGLQRYRHGGENVRFINALALLSGNMGIPGGGSCYHLHSLESFDMDWVRAARKPGQRIFTMPLTGAEILNAQDPPVRMLWINGTNIVNQAPDCAMMIRAFASVAFKVVVDAFMTDTAARADLILPSTLMLEQPDLVGSFLHNYIHYVPAVLDPPGEAKDDHTILTELGRLLDPPVHLPDPAACFQAALASRGPEAALPALMEAGWREIPQPAVAYENLIFDHADGRARLPLKLHPEPDPPAGFPLRLLTLIRRETIHSQMAAEQQVWPPKVWVSPECPGLGEIDPARPVYLASPLGRLRVQAEEMPGLHPYTVIYRRGDWMKRGGGANRLVAAGVTDLGNGAPYYDQYVRLENGPESDPPA